MTTEDLTDATSEYLRRLAAQIAGILAEKDGVRETVLTYWNIADALQKTYTAERSADA